MLNRTEDGSLDPRPPDQLRRRGRTLDIERRGFFARVREHTSQPTCLQWVAFPGRAWQRLVIRSDGLAPDVLGPTTSRSFPVHLAVNQRTVIGFLDFGSRTKVFYEFRTVLWKIPPQLSPDGTIQVHDVA